MNNQHPVCISAAHPAAVEAGMSVLRNGGNAVDAAIAISYMLGVVEPYASGIGGGGVMLISPSGPGDATVIDYREVAPMSGIISKYEVGVPGFVKGMEEVHANFGSMEMHSLIEPSIVAANEGFPAGKALVQQLIKAQHLEKEQFPQFFPTGIPVREGDTVQQPMLAETMRKIQRCGADWFYEGELAESISEQVEGLEKDDFHSYTVSIKKPIYDEYGEFEIITVPPPFGGVTLIQALKMSESLKLHQYPEFSLPYYTLWGEVIGKCYALRKTTMGDPDFTKVPTENLISNECIEHLVQQIKLDVISPEESPQDVANTTHFVVADSNGMYVSVTNTIGGFFSSGISAGGFFLNNQLRNFTEDPQSPNNPSPGKRPQSYVCPTIFRNHLKTIVIGSAGGKRIPMTLAIILMKIMKQDCSIDEAVSSLRFFIDNAVLHAESEVPSDVKDHLERLGYQVIHNPDPMFYGGVHGLMVNHQSGEIFGSADSRRGGAWMSETCSEDINEVIKDESEILELALRNLCGAYLNQMGGKYEQ